MRHVSIKEEEHLVMCPICGQVIDLDDVTTACEHLDFGDYITPKGPFMCGYVVWFKEG